MPQSEMQRFEMLENEPRLCLQVTAVAKTYRVFDSPAQRLKDLLGLAGEHLHVNALKPVSFTINRGETVAIVGANGSGKSTLLQLICGTLTPSQGEVQRHGRITALLELGAGFNPEFSGLDNVFLNASINGLSREQTQAKLEQILNFADIGDYIHQPVATYSSGMYVRLAFAVAIHLEPELLIIDEALAVGDEAFQRKCFSRLRELQSQGVSILFVSHSAESVVSLCDRALLLDKGELLADGEPRQVVALYQKLLYARPEQRASLRDEIIHGQNNPQPADSNQPSVTLSSSTQVYPPHPFDFIPGMVSEGTDFHDNGAHISQVLLLDEQEQQVNMLHKGRVYCYRYRVTFSQAASNVFFGTLIKRIDGVNIGGACTTPPEQPQGIEVHAGEQVEVNFMLPLMLNAGTYFINAGVHGELPDYNGFLARKLDAFMFKVVSSPADMATGNVDLGMTSSVNRLEFAPGANNE
ncbi:MAG: ABC transporter ATP-binding protein [Oceanisphaera sp.]|uniref:ABC transporter ATP-binding protein n=1 Tax=Oceanisphaera sp. TaxID=1929979 RepID=UPI003C791746